MNQDDRGWGVRTDSFEAVAHCIVEKLGLEGGERRYLGADRAGRCSGLAMYLSTTRCTI